MRGRLAALPIKTTLSISHRATLSRKRRVELQTSQSKLMYWFCIEQPCQGNVGLSWGPANQNETNIFVSINPVKETPRGCSDVPSNIKV